MSQMPVTARPVVRAPRRAEPARPRLQVVPTSAPRSARRLPFVVLCSFVLAAGLLSLLFLNLSLARGSYALHDLQNRSAVLAEQEQSRHEQLAQLESPTALAARATALGMVQGVSPAVLRLPHGQVVGVPQAAPKPTSTVSTAASDSTAASSAAAGSGVGVGSRPSSASSASPDTGPTRPAVTSSTSSSDALDAASPTPSSTNPR